MGSTACSTPSSRIWARNLKDSTFTSGGQIANAVGLLTLLQNTRNDADVAEQQPRGPDL